MKSTAQKLTRLAEKLRRARQNQPRVSRALALKQFSEHRKAAESSRLSFKH